jgi:hypothetical protein
MLAYILAVLVGTGSVGLYIAAFFFPEIHRKHDFVWSGVGFFYALTLWIYARQNVGGIVVGQTASVALLGWFGWQTLKLRRQLVPEHQQTPLPNPTKIQQQLSRKLAVAQPATPAKSNVPTSPTPQAGVEVKRRSPIKSKYVPATEAVTEVKPPVAKQIGENTEPDPPVVATPIVEPKEQAAIELEQKQPTTASKPLGQAVRPPVPPERPQQALIEAGAIVESIPEPVDRKNISELESVPIESTATLVEPALEPVDLHNFTELEIVPTIEPLAPVDDKSKDSPSTAE